MQTTTLHSIITDHADRYAFELIVAELTIRVVVSTVFGDHFGATAVVDTGEEYPAEDAYVYTGNLHPLPAHARGAAGEVARHRMLWTLASDVERAIQRLSDERVDELVARYGMPMTEDEYAAALDGDVAVLAPLTDEEEAELDAQAAAEVELDAYADRAFAEELERRAAEGTWWGRDDSHELAF